MFTLRRRKDAFRLILPKEIIPEEINSKYSKKLKEAKSFYSRPIDLLNESIQKIDVLGFNNGTMQQQQSSRGTPLMDPRRVQQNRLMHMAADVNYRNPDSYLKIIDKTLNIEFRHTLGLLNYFLLFETFIYQHSRDMKSKDLNMNFNIELLNENGAVYSKIILYNPLIDGLDMLSFDNTSPIAQTESFKCVFKYNNFDYQFILTDPITGMIDFDEYLDEMEQDHPFVQPGLPQVKNPRRIPKFKSDSPVDNVPGGLPYDDNWKGLGDGQIFYEDEGGVLDDILHHERKNTPGKVTNSGNQNGGNNQGNSEENDGNQNGGNNQGNSGNNQGNQGNSEGNNGNQNSNQDGNMNSGNNKWKNGNVKEPDPGSFIEMIATGKMEYSDGLAENEKFLYYPYDKDYENRKRQLSTFEITESIDKSMTKTNEEGEVTDEYPDRSEYPKWEDVDFQKFRNKK